MKIKIYAGILFLTSFLISTTCLACIPPVITSQPSNAVVCSGGNTSFTTSATGALTYQWQVNQGSGFINLSNIAPYSGVTTSTLAITGATVTLSDYTYRCIVSNGCAPDDTSNAVLIKVNTAPSIFTQPTNTSVCEGGNGSFSVTTSGSGLLYQWQVNMGAGFVNIPTGAPYTGDTTATLYITGASASMNGYVYQCIISGACPPSLTTNPVTLTIDTLPVITMQPVTAHVCDGTNAVFSVSATGAGLTYQWQEDQGSGFSNLSNTTPYSGVTTSTLTIAASVAMSGYSYQCIVSGTCSPSVTTIPYPMIVYPTYVNYKPVTICQGDSVAFAGSFYSTPGLYPHLYSSRFGCDSLVYLSLNVSSAYFTTITSTICNGDTIMIGGMPETTAGTYTYILPTISGCDSTIENILTVKPSYHYTQSTTICAGDSALIFGIYETTAGTYYDYHTTYLGCDSSYAHTLIVGPLYNNSATVNICAGDSVLISGNYESVAGNYVDSLSSVSGCDSVFTTTLIVHPVSNVFQAISICSNDSIFLAGAYQNTAGTYTDNFVSIFGCDSTIVTNLDVKTAPAVSLNFPPFVCEWDPPTVLTEGTPSGGTYSGTGITSGNIFSPGIVGPGNYLITYTYSDSVACTVSVTDTLTVAICEGVNELANDESIVVYPNPFINVFTITSKANTATQLTIINVLGEVVYSQVLKTGTSEINMSSVEKGIYFIKINDSGKIITKKIIKE